MNMLGQFLLSAIILFTSGFALCAPPVVLEEGKGEYPLGLHLDLLEDKEGKWMLEDVMGSKLADKFVVSQQQVPYFSNSESIYWARFKLDVGPDDHRNWFIWIFEWVPSQLYIPMVRGDYLLRNTDPLAPFSERQIRHPHFVLNLPKNFDHRRYLYIRVTPTHFGDVRIYTKILSEQYFDYGYADYLYIQGIYFGFIIVMMFYNIFIYLSVRDQSYLYYVAYIAMFGLAAFSNEGLGFQYLWSDMPQWNLYCASICTCMYMFFITKFIQVVLKTNAIVPGLHQACNGVAFLWLASIPIILMYYKIVILLLVLLAITTAVRDELKLKWFKFV